MVGRGIMNNYQTFSHTVIGASHIKENKVCQDYSLHKLTDNYTIAIVCDGHGGDKYFRSDRGSHIAAEQTMEAIEEWMQEYVKIKDVETKKEQFISNTSTSLKQLSANIIFRWYNKIVENYINEPYIINDKKTLKTISDLHQFIDTNKWIKAYGTTLMAVVLTSDFWFGLHIGDGKCVVIDNDWNCSQPIPWDESCFLNQTTSLCDENAIDKFRFFFSKENLPIAIYVASDGVDDTYTTDDLLHNFYTSVTKLFVSKGFEAGTEELKGIMPILSEKGSRDDISIAGIVNMFKLSQDNISIESIIIPESDKIDEFNADNSAEDNLPDNIESEIYEKNEKNLTSDDSSESLELDIEISENNIVKSDTQIGNELNQ